MGSDEVKIAKDMEGKMLAMSGEAALLTDSQAWIMALLYRAQALYSVQEIQKMLGERDVKQVYENMPALVDNLRVELDKALEEPGATAVTWVPVLKIRRSYQQPLVKDVSVPFSVAEKILEIWDQGWTSRTYRRTRGDVPAYITACKELNLAIKHLCAHWGVDLDRFRVPRHRWFWASGDGAAHKPGEPAPAQEVEASEGAAAAAASAPAPVPAPSDASTSRLSEWMQRPNLRRALDGMIETMLRVRMKELQEEIE